MLKTQIQVCYSILEKRKHQNKSIVTDRFKSLSSNIEVTLAILRSCRKITFSRKNKKHVPRVYIKLQRIFLQH